MLYDELTEAEYLTHVVDDKPPTAFDHGYVMQLGLAFLDDSQRWERGCEYLRIAAAGLPAQGPATHLKIAKVHEKAGNFAEVWRAYESVKKAGQKVGAKELDAENRQTYFAVVKVLGEDAAKRGDSAAAIENYRLFAEYERSGIQTYRTLAELYERQGNVWAALYSTEHGLVYDGNDADLLARKDKYYYSVEPRDVQANSDRVRKWFDIGYCKQKARWLVDHMGEDLDLLDWATHLAGLAQAMEPASMEVRVLRARMLRSAARTTRRSPCSKRFAAASPKSFPVAKRRTRGI